MTRGVEARAAAFTSVTPGADLSRLAAEQEAELLVVDAPDRLLEDTQTAALLEEAPCDVAVLVDGRSRRRGDDRPLRWSGARLVGGRARRVVRARNAAAAAGCRCAIGADGGDASRLLASASLAVQRAFGVDAEPMLVEPTPEALVEATATAALVVVGLTDRWRRDGIGHARAALAASPHHPTLLVRRGLRPGGLGPRSSQTRFTWTIGPGG